MMEKELIVIGAGPAGMTAGMYGVRSGLDSLVLERGICGGLSNEAPAIENYPGFNEIGGMELASRMKEHVMKYVEIRELERVDVIEPKADGFEVSTDKNSYHAKAIVICTGTRHRRLGVKGEGEFLGKGVSYCAACDGFFFKNRNVAVVGGGDSAARTALYLYNLGCQVTLIHRRDALRAEQYLQQKLGEADVNICWNSVVKVIKGDNVVKSVVIDTRGVERELPVAGVFVAIGEDPNSELAAKIGVTLDEKNYIITDKSQRTNIKRVYAAGDVTGGLRQVVVACAEGAIAASSAYEDLV